MQELGRLSLEFKKKMEVGWREPQLHHIAVVAFILACFHWQLYTIAKFSSLADNSYAYITYSYQDIFQSSIHIPDTQHTHTSM